jgi:alcohol dehydrogenase
MKSVRHGIAGARLEDAPEPAPARGEALVRVLRAGVTPWDLSVLDGLLRFKGVMGHECVGVVAGVNAAIDRDHAWEGKRVAVSPVVPCAACERCRGGLSAHCAARKVMGLHERDGCWAERVAAPIANLVELPKGLRDEDALLAGVVGDVLHAAATVRLEGKPFVTILGDGAHALVAAQVMAKRNASVRVLGWEPARFSLAERWRIRHRHVSEVGRRQDQDVVFDFSGSARGLEVALHLVRPRGRVVLGGWPAPVPRTALVDPPTGPAWAPAVCGELEIVGAGPGSLREAVDALARGEVDVSSLITLRGRLVEIAQAIAHARSPECVRVVLDDPGR